MFSGGTGSHSIFCPEFRANSDLPNSSKEDILTSSMLIYHKAVAQQPDESYTCPSM